MSSKIFCLLILLQVNHSLGGIIEGKDVEGDCRLMPGAQCDPRDEPCCEKNCTFSAVRVVKECSDDLCRHDICTGKSSECPPRREGSPCDKCSGSHGCRCDDKGFCVSNDRLSRSLRSDEEATKREDPNVPKVAFEFLGLGIMALVFFILFFLCCITWCICLCVVCWCNPC